METLNEYLNRKYCKATADKYGKDIARYLETSGSGQNGRYADIMDYIGMLRSRYANARTIRGILASVKAYYSWLCHVGIREDNPAKSIVLKDRTCRDVQLQDLFTPEELEALLHRPERYGLHVVRNEVLMSLLVYQALTPREISALRVPDIDLRGGTVQVAALPGSNGRKLPLKPQQVMLLLTYLRETRPKLLKGKGSEALVIGKRGNGYRPDEVTGHVSDRYRDEYAPRKVTPLRIRQSVIANLLAAGHDLRVVQVFAGHKSLSATEQYRQTATAALREQIRQHHPIR